MTKSHKKKKKILTTNLRNSFSPGEEILKFILLKEGVVLPLALRLLQFLFIFIFRDIAEVTGKLNSAVALNISTQFMILDLFPL